VSPLLCIDHRNTYCTTTGRLCHAVSLTWDYGEGAHVPLRTAGMLLTLGSIVGSVGFLLTKMDVKLKLH
jgi:hypothetical protein